MLHRSKIQEKEVRQGNDIATLLPILSSASSDLRAQCLKSTQVLGHWFSECNTRRWSRLLQPLNTATTEDRHDKLITSLVNLERALSEFQQHNRMQLLTPFERFFHPETGRLPDHFVNDPTHPNMFHVRSLFVCFTFADTLVAFSEELISLLKNVIDLDTKRKKPRVWFPTSLTKRIRHAAQGSNSQLDPMGLGYRRDSTMFAERSLSIISDGSDSSKNVTDLGRKAPRTPQTRICLFLNVFLRLSH